MEGTPLVLIWQIASPPCSYLRGIGAMLVGTFLYDQVDPLAPWIAGSLVSLAPWQACGGILSAWECHRMGRRTSLVDSPSSG